MKRILIVLLGLFLIGLCSPAATPAQESKVHKIMEAKLKASQSLLAGIATEDFQKITLSAQELIRLTRTEEWAILKTPKYTMHSNEFRRTAEVILQKAKAKSIDGVTLTYFEMTMSCVRCHQYVREVRNAQAPLPRTAKVAFLPTP